MALLTAFGGSLAVCLVTKTTVYLAADSRYCGGSRDDRDTARKLLPVGKTALCALSGLIRFTRTEFDLGRAVVASEKTIDLSDVILALAPRLEGEEPAEVHEFAVALYEALLPLWSSLGRNLDEPFRAPGSLTDLLYANRGRSGTAFVASIRIRHCPRRSDTGGYESIIEAPKLRPLFHGVARRACFFARGRTECFDPIPLDQDPSDQDAVRVLNVIFQTATSNPGCASNIGGPVDIAAVDSCGRRWLQMNPRGSPLRATRTRSVES